MRGRFVRAGREKLTLSATVQLLRRFELAPVFDWRTPVKERRYLA
jgi:hypothetical protein